MGLGRGRKDRAQRWHTTVLVEKNIGGHQHGIAEETERRRLLLLAF